MTLAELQAAAASLQAGIAAIEVQDDSLAEITAELAGVNEVLDARNGAIAIALAMAADTSFTESERLAAIVETLTTEEEEATP